MSSAAVVSRQAFVHLSSDVDLVVARRVVRDSAREIGFTLIDLTKVVTAASELARNALMHGGGGVMCLQIVSSGARQGLRLTFEDEGPGIARPDLAMRDGYTTAGGMGIGLPGARRLVNEFDLSSAPGEGTSVTIVRWRP